MTVTDDQPAAAGLSPAVVRSGLVLGLVAVSASAPLIRAAAAPALAIAFWRTAVGALLLAPAGWRHRLRPDGSPVLTAREWRLLVVGGLSLALHFALFVASVSLTTVASAATLATMSPIFVGLGSRRFLGEPPSRRTWIGLGLTLAGAVVVGVADLRDADLGGKALLGDAMALASSLAVTGYMLVGRDLRRDGVANSLYGSAVYGVAGLALLPFVLVTGADLAGYDGGTWLALAGIIVGPQMLGHTVFNALMSTVTATVVAVVVLAEPLGTALLGWLFLDELPPALFWAGGPLILAGVYVATSRPRIARATVPGD